MRVEHAERSFRVHPVPGRDDPATKVEVGVGPGHHDAVVAIEGGVPVEIEKLAALHVDPILGADTDPAAVLAQAVGDRADEVDPVVRRCGPGAGCPARLPRSRSRPGCLLRRLLRFRLRRRDLLGLVRGDHVGPVAPVQAAVARAQHAAAVHAHLRRFPQAEAGAVHLSLQLRPGGDGRQQQQGARRQHPLGPAEHPPAPGDLSGVGNAPDPDALLQAEPPPRHRGTRLLHRRHGMSGRNGRGGPLGRWAHRSGRRG